MADYIARYSKGPDLPVVTHSPEGQALVYTPYGTLAQANRLEGFIAVEPYVREWQVSGTFGVGAVAETGSAESWI